MEITNTLPKQPLTTLQTNPQSQKDLAANNANSSLNNDDKLNLSINPQQLSTSAGLTGTSIGNHADAQSIAGKIAQQIQSFPNLAITSHSNVNTLNFKTLLG